DVSTTESYSPSRTARSTLAVQGPSWPARFLAVLFQSPALAPLARNGAARGFPPETPRRDCGLLRSPGPLRCRRIREHHNQSRAPARARHAGRSDAAAETEVGYRPSHSVCSRLNALSDRSTAVLKSVKTANSKFVTRTRMVGCGQDVPADRRRGCVPGGGLRRVRDPRASRAPLAGDDDGVRERGPLSHVPRARPPHRRPDPRSDGRVAHSYRRLVLRRRHRAVLRQPLRTRAQWRDDARRDDADWRARFSRRLGVSRLRGSVSTARCVATRSPTPFPRFFILSRSRDSPSKPPGPPAAPRPSPP